MSQFVTTDWLAERLDDPQVIIVDATWHMPNAGRDARAEFEASHIPGAVHFDIDAISDTRSDLPHMLPDEQTFGAVVGALGIGSEQTIVVYDEHGLFSAPRAWWSLKVMGARNVCLLDGGGPKWRAENRPLETGSPPRSGARFNARLDTAAVASFNAVLAASRTGNQIVDARPAARFSGETPEPRPGLRAGHIPGSANLPFSALVADGHLKPADALRAQFTSVGIDLEKPVITTCGSGVTAAILALALETIGARQVALYDGSWSEWGAHADAPVSGGAA